MKRLALLLAVLSLAPNVAAAQPAPVDVYAILDLTGPSAFIGKAAADSLQAIEGVVNRTGGIRGRPLHFVVQDGQSNPVTVVQLYNTIAARHVPIVIGPSVAADCQAVVPLAANGPVTYCLSNAIHPPAGSYVFSSLASSADLAIDAIRYYRARGFRRIAMLSSTDATGRDGDAVVAAALALPENKDVTLVDAEHFNPTDISVSAQLARIKGSGAQAMIAWCTGTPFGTVLRGMTDAGLDLPVITHAGNVSNVEMEQFGAFLPAQAYFVGYRFMGPGADEAAGVRDAQATFYESFRKLGTAPDVAAGTTWDGAMIAVAALRKLGPDASAKQVRDYIEGLRAFPGINGLMNFTDGSQRGLGPQAAIVVRWDKGAKRWVAVSRPGGVPL